MSKRQDDLIPPSAPTVRLVANAHQGREEAKAQALGPTMRIATFDIPAVHMALSAPAERLAHQPGSQCDNSTKEGGWAGTGAPVNNVAPSLLVSYVYVQPFLDNQVSYYYRDWVLDSGAFSAQQSGTRIELSCYIDFAAKLLAEDPTLVEVFALDVIPEDQKPITVARAAEQSLKNCEEAWRQGVKMIPTFHIGEEEQHLMHIAAKYPKIALGGVALLKGGLKFRWCEQCFARVWPKKVHGFGMSTRELVYGLPFHSVDATNWELAPCAFGNWEKFGTMSVRGSNQDLRSQVKHYLNMEAKARVRWKAEMKLLEELAPAERIAPSPSVRLAIDAGAAGGQRARAALQKVALEERHAKKMKECAKVGTLDEKWAGKWWE